MRCIHVKTNNTFSIVKFKKFEELQKLVGGTVERVLPRPIPFGFCMLVHEDAHTIKYPPPINVWASKFYGGPVIGDVVIARECNGSQGVDFCDMEDEDVAHWRWWLKTWFLRL